MSRELTLDLNVVLTNYSLFAWGEIVHIYRIDRDHHIIEYHPWWIENFTEQIGRVDYTPSLRSYLVYTDNEPADHAWGTFDAAKRAISKH